MKTIMFTGHRDSVSDAAALENIAALYDNCTWVHGGADGFDAQVENVAKAHGITTRIYRPDYKKYASRVAPLIRNREMLAASDLVVACYDGRKTGGTFFTVTEARKEGKKVVILSAHRHIPTPAG